MLAMEKGFFKEQGINLEYVAFNNNDQMIAPMGTDELDVGALLVTPAVLNAKDRGIDLRLVADKGTSRPKYESYWIMLRKDLADSGQVKTPADLKGMKVAIMARGAMGHQTAELMLAKGGLSEKDVADAKYEILPPPNHAPAFGNKAIAASFVIDPFATALVQQGLAVKWFASSSLYPGNSIEAATVAYAPKLAKNTDLGRRWMVAYLKGVRYYFEALKPAQGKAEIAAAVAKYTPIKDPKMFEDMEPAYLDPNGALDSASLKFQYDWLVKEGAYTGKTTFQDLIDTSFADYAVQQLGKYQ
ncbi:MAG: ABC transporter substrate-binding protein [Dehalococcoidia bacterium]|nr:ABC transporter substrate-binding protein [Dehalococcoidia bacterium]